MEQYYCSNSWRNLGVHQNPIEGQDHSCSVFDLIFWGHRSQINDVNALTLEEMKGHENIFTFDINFVGPVCHSEGSHIQQIYIFFYQMMIFMNNPFGTIHGGGLKIDSRSIMFSLWLTTLYWRASWEYDLRKIIYLLVLMQGGQCCFFNDSGLMSLFFLEMSQLPPLNSNG